MEIPSLYPCPLSPHTYIQDSDAVGLGYGPESVYGKWSPGSFIKQPDFGTTSYTVLLYKNPPKLLTAKSGASFLLF